jgi:tRNA(Arg) A34 adenosine deaminase TadA
MPGLSTPTAKSARKPTDSEQMLKIVEFTARGMKGLFPTPFGSSIVATKDGSLLSRQVNHGRQNLDPTAHAEVHVIRSACRRLKSMSLQGYSLYTTCEPCPMCMAASLWARLDRVIYGATIEDASKYCGQIYTSSKQLVKKSDLVCEVVGPVERERCIELFEASPMRRPSAKK